MRLSFIHSHPHGWQFRPLRLHLFPEHALGPVHFVESSHQEPHQRYQEQYQRPEYNRQDLEGVDVLFPY